MKRFSVVILGLTVVTLLAVIFFVLVSAVRAEEGESEVEKALKFLGKVERTCPPSNLSNEQYLFDILIEMDRRINLAICQHRGFFFDSGLEAVEELWNLLTLQQRVQEILSGPCCARIRALQGTKEPLFDQEDPR